MSKEIPNIKKSTLEPSGSRSAGVVKATGRELVLLNQLSQVTSLSEIVFMKWFLKGKMFASRRIP
ncbi:hypothetical protein C4572_01745 [Candidatus Parcubacteria bacterium]|nr:MAG: hypothetical protein C4572_01745 [Candidatus Parcubacteria bacterium]